MKLYSKQGLLTGAVLISIAAPIFAEDMSQDQSQTRDQQQIRDQDIYGSQLMTPQERTEFRSKMRAAKTVEERERIRKEHHELMKARAKERGITLPDEPPMMPGGMGPGGGGMMGPGGGMGPGGNRP
jgi:hypothetical protein